MIDHLACMQTKSVLIYEKKEFNSLAYPEGI